MELQYLVVRLPVARPEALDLAPFIPVFHRWIREGWCPELLIDVADYRHVPFGPGVVLVGHEADYAMENGNSAPALRYTRKDVVAGGNGLRLRQVLGAAFAAAARLEAAPELAGALRFNRRELELSVNDRLLVPNEPATYRAVLPELQDSCRELLGKGAEFTYGQGDPRERFTIGVRMAEEFSLEHVPAQPP